MNFFQRLFQKKNDQGRVLVPVPKHTRAGKKGKTVFCPRAECRYPTHVHNFAWSALVCQACGATINKYDWLIQNREEK